MKKTSKTFPVNRSPLTTCEQIVDHPLLLLAMLLLAASSSPSRIIIVPDRISVDSISGCRIRNCVAGEAETIIGFRATQLYFVSVASLTIRAAAWFTSSR